MTDSDKIQAAIEELSEKYLSQHLVFQELVLLCDKATKERHPNKYIDIIAKKAMNASLRCAIYQEAIDLLIKHNNK